MQIKTTFFITGIEFDEIITEYLYTKFGQMLQTSTDDTCEIHLSHDSSIPSLQYEVTIETKQKI